MYADTHVGAVSLPADNFQLQGFIPHCYLLCPLMRLLIDECDPASSIMTTEQTGLTGLVIYWVVVTCITIREQTLQDGHRHFLST